MQVPGDYYARVASAAERRVKALVAQAGEGK
jgi:hypothetical protein